jgi:hypothetical protein
MTADPRPSQHLIVGKARICEYLRRNHPARRPLFKGALVSVFFTHFHPLTKTPKSLKQKE